MDFFSSFPASPVNPADINLIQGTYGFKPDLPACAGLEGVAEVMETGNNVKNIRKGEWVLLPAGCWGSWRQFGVAKENESVPCDSSIIYSHLYFLIPGCGPTIIIIIFSLKVACCIEQT